MSQGRGLVRWLLIGPAALAGLVAILADRKSVV